MIFDAPPQPEGHSGFLLPSVPVDARRAWVMVPSCAASMVVLLGVLLADEMWRNRQRGYPDVVSETAYLALMGLYAVIAITGMIPRSRPFGYAVTLVIGVPAVAQLVMMLVALPMLLLSPFNPLRGVDGLQVLVYALIAPVHVMLVLYAWAGVRETPPSVRTGVIALLATVAYLFTVYVGLEQRAAREIERRGATMITVIQLPA